MDKEKIARASAQEALTLLHTAADGLSTEEIKHRRTEFGFNVLKKDRPTGWQIFFKQFRSSLIYLLILAAALSFALQDFSDGLTITFILFVNALLGFFQEYRSEKTIQKLSQFISRQVIVIREKKTDVIDVQFLVPGDVILLREGDIAPADCKILETENLEMNESQLTGESVPVSKKAGAGGDASLVFAGSVVEKGETKAVVYAINNETELGKVADLSRNTKKVTQYEQSLQAFSNYLLRIILITLALVFVTKVFITHDVSHITTLFLFIIALAITVIPEALPVIAIVTLSKGALLLAKKFVVVKRLSALEDLGNVNLLCTDKTGTLTENKLRIEKAITEDEQLFQKLSFAAIENLEVHKKKFRSAYDEAFLAYIPKTLQHPSRWKHITEIPFDPEVRRKRIIAEDTHEHIYYLIEVGSAETLLTLAKTSKKKEYLSAIQEDGKKGIRHIALAYKKISYTKDFDILKHENDLEFLGYVQLIDPLRKTAESTIQQAKKLGVAIKILTGDSVEVAQYVGQEVGLLQPGEKVYTGEEIDRLQKSELHAAIEVCSVFARVTPQQKYTIIEILKEQHVVAYQGDGINDAPALKLADVAIAVNTATDVAKESADIVLLKDGLYVIIDGIRYGREIFVNINKYIKHTMVGNLGNFFSLAILYLFAVDLPLLPIQLLLGNLIQDLPLISVYSDNVDENEIERPEHYNIHSLMLLALFLGLFSGIYDLIYSSIVGFHITQATQTNLFLFFTFAQLIVILSVRNKGHMWAGKKPSLLVIGFIVLFLLLSLLLPYITPIAQLFSFSALSLRTIGLIVAATVVYILLLDYMKVTYYRIVRGHKAN